MASLHPIPPGLYCVPAALVAITGEPVAAVIFPTLNRLACTPTLIETVAGVQVSAVEAALQELGYRVCRYKSGAAGPLRARVSTWARRSSERYSGKVLLLCTRTHCLVALDGRVYDNHMPHGPLGEDHSWARTVVTYAALVERR